MGLRIEREVPLEKPRMHQAVPALRRRANGCNSEAVLDEREIVDGIDELGVRLYGRARNAYW